MSTTNQLTFSVFLKFYDQYRLLRWWENSATVSETVRGTVSDFSDVPTAKGRTLWLSEARRSNRNQRQRTEVSLSTFASPSTQDQSTVHHFPTPGHSTQSRTFIKTPFVGCRRGKMQLSELNIFLHHSRDTEIWPESLLYTRTQKMWRDAARGT